MPVFQRDECVVVQNPVEDVAALRQPLVEFVRIVRDRCRIDDLISIDKNTGTGTVIGSTGVYSVSALAMWSPTAVGVGADTGGRPTENADTIRICHVAGQGHDADFIAGGPGGVRLRCGGRHIDARRRTGSQRPPVYAHLIKPVRAPTARRRMMP